MKVNIKPAGIAIAGAAIATATLAPTAVLNARRMSADTKAQTEGKVMQEPGEVNKQPSRPPWEISLGKEGDGKLEATTLKDGPPGLTTMLRVTVKKAGKFQNAVAAARIVSQEIKAGRKLALRFYARATTTVPIKAVVMGSVELPEGERDLSAEQILTPEWRQYTYRFVVKQDYKPKEARLQLRVGKGNGTYEFSQIELIDTAEDAGIALFRDFSGNGPLAPLAPVEGSDSGNYSTVAGLTPVKMPEPSAPIKATGPNIIFILADDLGYGDIGPFGQQKIKTPNLERMAVEGQRWTDHYAASPVCVPTRAALMLGLHTGNLPIRDHQFDSPLPETSAAPNMASVLQRAGYATFAVGKWGIGGGKANMPAHPQRRGFDHWFGLYSHVDGHVHYPDTEHPIFDGFTNVTADHKDHYSTDLYTAKAKQYITEQARTHPNQPFFLYLAYIAPHAQYQVPDGPYPASQGVNGGVQWPLKANPAQKNAWLYPDLDPSWSDWQKRYATMVRRVDEGVGDVLQTLRDLKIDKNTIVVFTSDNGPARDPDTFRSWGPFDGFKRDLYEGGMREPTLVWWPGTVKPGVSVSLPSAHYDWLPTFTDLAGVISPVAWDGISLAPTLTRHGTQRSHDYLYWEFHGPSELITDRQVLGRHGYPTTGADPWGNQQAVRIGDFVGLRVQIQGPETPLRLYNVATDPHEDHDLAADPKYAPLIAQMKDLMRTAHRPQPGNPRPYENAPLPATSVPVRTDVRIRAYPGTWYWTPDTQRLTPKSEQNAAAPSLAPLAGQPGAVEITGTIVAPETGTYTLSLDVPGRIHLWVQEAHVISGEAGVKEERNGAVPLAKGVHPYRLVVVPADPNAPIHLSVTRAGGS